MKIRKAVIPAAGFGIRLLPATKAMPKEMLNVVDKPAIQYVIEEAVAAGIEEILIIVSRGKEMLMDHFDETPELDAYLAAKGEEQLIELSRSLAKKAKIFYTRQGSSKGLGHAILCAREFIGDEPFAVMLSDDIMAAADPVIGQLIRTHQISGASVLGVQPVRPEDVSRYGIVAGTPDERGDWQVTDLVEKPPAAESPSTMAILGRYVLSPSIFRHIEQTPPGKGGEIHLTDAIRRLLDEEAIVAHPFTGIRHDTGNKLGYLKATLDLALDRDEFREDLIQYLKEKDLI